MKKQLEKIKVSVICGVYNEEETFEKHLQSLVDQSHKNKEIIIVDDGSKDSSGKIGKKFAKKYKFIKYNILNHIDGYGCVRPRLEAIKKAKGEVYCMVDADAYYEKDYIKNGIEMLFSDEKIGAVVPRMHFWNPRTFISKYKSLLYEIKFNNLDIINKEINEAKHSPWILKKEVYNKVGGYNIKDAYCEDVRLAKRILDAGYKLVHNGNCHWHHKLEENPSDVIRKNFSIGRMHSTEKKFNLKTIAKNCFFLLPIIILVISLFNYQFIILLLLHFISLSLNGLKVFMQARNIKGRIYAFYSPMVSYFVNIPSALGFIYGFIRPYKK